MLPAITPGRIRGANAHAALGLPPGTQPPLTEGFGVFFCFFEGASDLVNGTLSKNRKYLEIK